MSSAPPTDPQSALATQVERALREIPDFPRPGIRFRDITPLLASPSLFMQVTKAMAEPFAGRGVSHVVAIESRGFLFGGPVAQHLGAALVPVRKPGKLPFRAQRLEYALEYGRDALEIHADACDAQGAVLIVDDVLATGGTARAAGELVARLGARVAGYSFLVELAGVGGRAALGAATVHSLATL